MDWQKALGNSCRHWVPSGGRNQVADDLWIRAAANELEDARECNFGLMVISDVRMTNEARWLKEQGGIIVQISREASEAVRPHASENGICQSLINYRIDNNGTLKELYRQVDEIICMEGLL